MNGLYFSEASASRAYIIGVYNVDCRRRHAFKGDVRVSTPPRTN